MALALPVQGLAAATLLHCAQPAAPAVQQHEHAHDHAHHGEPQADSQSKAAGHNSMGKCSACAACCAATALPVVWPSLPLLKPASATIAFQAQAWVAPVASGLERPPRTHLA